MMALPRIIPKLQKLLDAGIKSEADVVYLLAQTRKILELIEETKRYDYLSFHCNWVLHSRLDRGLAEKILDQFNEIHVLFKSGVTIEQLPPNLREVINGTASLDFFRAQLRHLYNRFSLPVYWMGELSTWSQFLRPYMEVIQDNPLIIQKTPSEARLARMSIEFECGDKGYRINWILTDKDGSQGAVFVTDIFNSDEPVNSKVA